MNKQTVLRVKTGVGTTEEGVAGEVLGQGSSGGALAGIRNIDKGIYDYFDNSIDEDVYGAVRLQPLIYVDYLLRSAADVRETNAGNVKTDRLVNESCLDFVQ